MTSQATSSMNDDAPESAVSLHKRIYFQERFKGHMHEVLYNMFRKREEAGLITRADLARRTGKRPEQITRMLNVSGNLRLETVSDLLLAMDVEPRVELREIKNVNRNNTGPEWLVHTTTPSKQRKRPVQNIIPSNVQGAAVQWKATIAASG